MARRLDDPATLDFVLTRRLFVLLGPEDLAERDAATSELLRSSTRSRVTELTALIFRIDDLGERGDRVGLDHALAVFEQTVRGSAPVLPLDVDELPGGDRHRRGAVRRGGSAGDGGAVARPAGPDTVAAHALRSTVLHAPRLAGAAGRGRTAHRARVAESAVVPAWRSALANFSHLVRTERRSPARVRGARGGRLHHVPPRHELAVGDVAAECGLRTPARRPPSGGAVRSATPVRRPRRGRTTPGAVD